MIFTGHGIKGHKHAGNRRMEALLLQKKYVFMKSEQMSNGRSPVEECK